MKKYNHFLLALAGAVLLFSLASGISMMSLAADRAEAGILQATPDEATSDRATPDDALPDESRSDSESEAVSEGEAASEFMALQPEAEEEYTFCTYNFYHADWPLEWVLGDEFNSEDELPDTVDLYLDGPNGHMDDAVELDVEWDLGGVDFSKEGEYTVTGTADTGKCGYPVNWNSVPNPTFIINIVEYGTGTLSFQAETSGNTVILNYEMNGEPFTLPFRWLNLYKSTDGGKKWYNITQSRQVRISDNRILISDVHSDAMFQADTPHLGDNYSRFSDIVGVKAAGDFLSVEIIASGGGKGGEDWAEDDEHSWEEEPQPDGPYSIIGYGPYRPLPSDPVPLKLVTDGIEDYLSSQDYLSQITVFYTDPEQDFWRERITLQAEWDWPQADAVDWEPGSSTIVYGHISEEDKMKNAALLDFDNMPELTMSIFVYKLRAPFLLEPPEEVLYENNTVILDFLDGSYNPNPFADISGLTVWCSIDGGREWYDITGKSNVSLTNGSLTVSYLKNEYIRDQGYTFQIEQTSHPERDRFSGSSCVSHDIYGLSFMPDAGGDRGGGNRQDKPPEGLFDTEQPKEEPSEEEPGEEEPSEELPTLPPETEPEPEVPQPPTENGPGEGENGSEENEPPNHTEGSQEQPGGGGNSSGGGSSSGSGSLDITPGADICPPQDTATGGPDALPAAGADAVAAGADTIPAATDAAIDPDGMGGKKADVSLSTAAVKAAADMTSAQDADSAVSEGDMPGTENIGSNSADGTSDKQNDQQNGSETIRTPETEPASFPRRIIHVAVSITALSLGAAGGFWMIRRR